MITIVKKPDFKPIRMTCPICGTVFEFEMSDLHNAKRYDMCDATKEQFISGHIQCPVCYNDLTYEDWKNNKD